MGKFSVSEASIALGPDGDLLAVAGFKGETEHVIMLSRLSKGKHVDVDVNRQVDNMLEYRSCILKFSPDGALLVAVYKGRKILQVGSGGGGGGAGRMPTMERQLDAKEGIDLKNQT